MVKRKIEDVATRDQNGAAALDGPAGTAAGPGWTTPGRGSLAETARSRILDLVLSRQVRAGEPLQERRLADWLEMSRTPVREALNHLEVEGVVRRQGKALIVHEITTREMMEIFAVREQLEGFAVRLATPSVDLAEVERLQAQVRGLTTDPAPPPQEHWAVDDALHDLPAKAAGNTILARYIADLRLRTRIFDMERLPDRFRPGCEEHLVILNAMHRRDAEAAVAAMQAHIRNARSAILEKLAQY